MTTLKFKNGYSVSFDNNNDNNIICYYEEVNEKAQPARMCSVEEFPARLSEIQGRSATFKIGTKFKIKGDDENVIYIIASCGIINESHHCLIVNTTYGSRLGEIFPVNNIWKITKEELERGIEEHDFNFEELEWLAATK